MTAKARHFLADVRAGGKLHDLLCDRRLVGLELQSKRCHSGREPFFDARASFVCCDSVEDAKLESADLIEPIAAGVLDWLEVHELQQVVGGELAGRQSDDDIVVFKSNGLAAWDVAVAAVAVERARERGLGRQL